MFYNTIIKLKKTQRVIKKKKIAPKILKKKHHITTFCILVTGTSIYLNKI